MKSNEPAFPHAIKAIPEQYSGLTKRDYIAIYAMCGLVTQDSNKLASNAQASKLGDMPLVDAIATLSYKIADAMIKEGGR